MKREAFRTMIAGGVRPVQRTLALAAVEADQMASGAGAPEHAVCVDIAAAQTHGLFRQRIELAELGLWIEAQESRRTTEYARRVPDRAVLRIRHHRVRPGAGIEAHVLAGLGLTRLGELVELAVAGGV